MFVFERRETHAETGRRGERMNVVYPNRPKAKMVMMYERVEGPYIAAIVSSYCYIVSYIFIL